MKEALIDKNLVEYDSELSSQELDDIKLNSSQRFKGIYRFLIFSIIGIVVFFISVPYKGKSEIVFSILYNGLVDLFGDYIYWILVIVIAGNLLLHIYYKYLCKKNLNSSIQDVYRNDNFIHTILYFLGLVYVLSYAVYKSFNFNISDIIVGDSTGGNVIPPIVKGVLGIILIGSIFMPFLLNYGVLEIVGALLEPIMRPLFKVPGKAALDATSSFVSSSSLGVLITNKLWKKGIYIEKEMVAIVTGFSAVSIGFAYLVINTAGVGKYWGKIYIVSFIMVFILEFIMVRIPPISTKSNIYYDGRIQTEKDVTGELKYSINTIPRGINRAIKRAYIANGIKKDIYYSLKDGLLVVPQVLTMLSAIGVTAMILAEYTDVFIWLGYIFQPILNICQVPEASAIAPSMPVGIAEMFLPVLLMNSQSVPISDAARIFVCLVSITQIIFFSETATVMLATKSPIKFWEIIVCFLERTIIAIPIASIFLHLLF